MMDNKMLIPVISAILSLALTSISGMALLNTASEEFIASMQHAAAASNCSSNESNSSVSLASREEMVSAPQNLTLVSGYYSSHPIVMGQGSGSRTVIANGNSATSMSHEISSARELSGAAEYRVESSTSRNAFGETSSATTHMQIDESVTSGRVSIGVLSGDGPQSGAGQSSIDQSKSAWRDPAIEIDEEYVGTYNISKNFTISSSYSHSIAPDGWLYCCGNNYSMSVAAPRLIKADDVFNCMSQKV